MAVGKSQKRSPFSGLASWRDGFFYDLQLNGPAPDRLIAPFADDYQPNAQAAKALVGEWIGDKADGLLLHGDISDIARKWLALDPGTADFARMHSFVWLRDFAGLGEDGELAATILIDAWLSLYSRYEPQCWALDITAERLIFLLRHAGPLLKRGDALWRSALLSAMARQARHLAKSANKAETPRTRLLAAISLTASGLLLPHHQHCAEQGCNLLRRELRLQLRQDGGHVSRNPSFQMELGLRLLALIKAYAAGGREVPGFIQHSAGKALSLVEFFRCGDGRLAVFNGACEDDKQAISVALTSRKVERQQIDFASHTGYQKLSAARTLVLADLGGPAAGGNPLHQLAPKKYNKQNLSQIVRPIHSHDGALSFQLSSGRHRIVVNCGAENPFHGTALINAAMGTPWQHALRQAAAHSSLSLADAPAEQSRCAPSLYHRLFEDKHGQLLEMERTGVEHLKKATHRRRLFLDIDGDDLRGEDVFVPEERKGQVDFVLRFHLHPTIKASLSRDRRSIILVTPGREGWRFQAGKAALALERSIYAGAQTKRQTSQQIVVTPYDFTGPVQIKWAFRRMKEGF